MKAFTGGMIVGAIACFAALRLIDSRVGEPAEPQSLPSSSLDGTPSTRVRVQEVRPPPAPKVAACTEPVACSPQDCAAHTVGKQLIAIDEIDEQEAGELCSRAAKLQQQREQAKKDAEPKDAAWAYAMEQMIRQHIESNARRDLYTQLQIECRTTFCDLEIKGTGLEARDAVEKVANEIPDQPWSDLAAKGRSGGNNGEDWQLGYEFFRPRTETERRAWKPNKP